MFCFCQQTYYALPADILCSASRHTMLCQQTYYALPADILCSASRLTMLCQQTYYTLPADIAYSMLISVALPRVQSSPNVSGLHTSHICLTSHGDILPIGEGRRQWICTCQKIYKISDQIMQVDPSPPLYSYKSLIVCYRHPRKLKTTEMRTSGKIITSVGPKSSLRI